jgi:hypothetical protein
MTDIWEVWRGRLHTVRNLVLTLPREIQGQQLDDQGRPTGVTVVLPAGTQVRYVQTLYDAMRLVQCWHTVKVVSGPATDLRVDIEDSVSAWPFPWEE